MEKKEQRAYYKAIRENLNKEQAEVFSARIQQYAAELLTQMKCKKILAYYPLGKEVSLLSLIEQQWSMGYKTAFPRVEGEELFFYEITDFSQLKEGCFHVMEPNAEAKRISLSEEAECIAVLTPGVAFDRAGGRIGYGKGFYDRFFQRYPNVLKIGIAYECQLAGKIIRQEHDVLMDYVITQNGIYDRIKV